MVGSGISGGWAAKELTEKGLRVLLLERGRNVEHVKDYVNATKAPWEYLHRGGRTYAMEQAYPVLKRDYPLNEKNLAFWVNEKDSPYTEIKRFDWYRGYQVGGRSLTWGRQSYRWSDYDFEANAKEGIAIDWPIRYNELAPWYDHVEQHAGISGSRDGLPQLPDGQFLPPMPLNCGEELVAGRLKNAFGGKRHMIIGRIANATKPLEGRAPCQYRNACWLGCPYGAYFSTQSSTLPAAVKTGKLTLEALVDRHRSAVRQGSQACHRRARAGCRLRADDRLYGESGFRLRLHSQFDLAADAIRDRYLARRVGQQLGRIGSQPHGSSFSLRRGRNLTGLDDKYYYGRRPNGIYIPRYRNLFGDKRDYLRGFGYQGAASREGWTRAVKELGLGAEFKDEMTLPGPWKFGATAFGEMLPESRQQHRHRHREEGQVGTAGTQDRLRHGRERALDAQGHDRRHGGDARTSRRENGHDIRRGVLSGNGHPRDGHGAHGTRSEDLGAQFAQSGLGCAERLRHRRVLHGLQRLSESLAHLHGAHCSRGGLRGERAQSPQPLS